MAAQDLNVLPIFSKWRGFNSNFALFDKIFSTKRHIFSNNFPTTHFCLGGGSYPLFLPQRQSLCSSVGCNSCLFIGKTTVCGVNKRVRSTYLYHSRQWSNLLILRSDRIDRLHHRLLYDARLRPYAMKTVGLPRDRDGTSRATAERGKTFSRSPPE